MQACRSCGAPVDDVILDLGQHPPSNAYYTNTKPNRLPLRVLVCPKCWFVQTEDVVGREDLFEEEYAYFSRYSSTWVTHCADYAETMTSRFGLNQESLVGEIACNDGTLLSNFASGMRTLGVEPTASTATAAREIGLEVIEDFFGQSVGASLRESHGPADLIAANNVLAHVPDVNDFVGGFREWLAEDGVATFEFPHLLNLMNERQFDTVYHEHFSYLSLIALQTVFAREGLSILDVEKLQTHGGSLRVFVQHAACARPSTDRVAAVIAEEEAAGLNDLDAFRELQVSADAVRSQVADWFASLPADSRVHGYGAAAKGNTLLNYCGLTDQDVVTVADANPHKQGKRLPGSAIPVVSPQQLFDSKPDYVIVLPWNIFGEVKRLFDSEGSMEGLKLVRFIPSLEVHDVSG